MVKCDKCGENLEEGMKFCHNCGAPLPEPSKKGAFLSGIFEKERGVVKEPPEISTKMPEAVQKSESPYLKKKKTHPLPPLLLLGIALILIVIVAFVMYTYLNPNKACLEKWVCGEWSKCVNATQERACVDVNACGTSKAEPGTKQKCQDAIEIPENNSKETPIEQVQCMEIGSYCDVQKDCCEGFCVHHLCQANKTYCQDGYCDAGENCTNCPYDCGQCPTQRELEQNVFMGSVSYFDAQDYLSGGYVIVRYFYNKDCSYCYYPVNIESQLRDLAASSKDLFVLAILDSDKYTFDANKYATVGATIYTPLIRVEGISNNQTGVSVLYGGTLGDMLQDGDITADIAPLICQYSDYCDFEGGRIVRINS